MSTETQALIIVAVPSIFSVLLVYAETDKKRWAWYCLFPVIVVADGYLLSQACRLGVLVFSRRLWSVPEFPGFEVLFGTLLLLSIFGGFTLWLWRQKPKWNR
jgi:hypothetical protein